MAGRPPKEFTEDQVELIKTLARCHCPDSEIAAAIGCGEATLQRHFDALLKEQREIGKSNIRAKQFRMAMNGDRTMLIWIGKQILNQREPSLQIDLRKVPDEQLMEVVKERLLEPIK